MEYLEPSFKLYTLNGEPNYIWAVNRYFNKICDSHHVNDSNRKLYLSDYNITICPYIDPNIPVYYYSNEDILFGLYNRIKQSPNISEQTFNSRHRHLLLDPLESYFKEYYPNDKSLWGSFFKIEDRDESFYSTKLVRRSFTLSEVEILCNLIKKEDAYKMSGEELAIILSWLLGTRLNELCALRYKDIKPMVNYPDEYVITVGALTTKLHSSDLKVGGKTYNAPRIIPLLDECKKLLLNRIDYLKSTVDFSTTASNDYNSVYELPIICQGDNCFQECGSDYISKCTKKFFIEKLHFDETRMALINQALLNDADLFAENKIATLYTTRRDFATEIENAFHNSKEGMTLVQYLLGHKIENPLYCRNDFTDEIYLHKMKTLLEKSHRINLILKK